MKPKLVVTPGVYELRPQQYIQTEGGRADAVVVPIEGEPRLARFTFLQYAFSPNIITITNCESLFDSTGNFIPAPKGWDTGTVQGWLNPMGLTPIKVFDF